MSTVLRVRLVGSDAELGRVAAGDVARMLLGVERTVARAAGQVIGRQVKTRRGRTIEEATRFRLLGIEEGSVVGVLELPPDSGEETLEVDVPSLGDLAVDAALATAVGEETRHVDVADAFVRLSDELGVGARFEALTIERERAGARRVFRLDRRARERLSDLVAAAPEARDEHLVGVLVEADFERNTARLRTAGGQGVSVRFEPNLADGIQEALRRQTELVGEVTYDPRAFEASSVSLKRIVRSEQLTMGFEPGEFWTARSISELADVGGIEPVEDVDVLRDDGASDDEVDRLLAAIAEM